MKRIWFAPLVALVSCLFVASCSNPSSDRPAKSGFVTIEGPNLVKPNGERLFIKGTNLSNWMNPEGYMFDFGETNSATRINRMLSELVGPTATKRFWKAFKDNYITKDDLLFIAQQGANTVRMPFNYRSFTDEDYMGVTSRGDGFERIDTLVSWCREAGLYLILDMHDAPGGQTGYNIDDSYGYPWLFLEQDDEDTFCNIWKKIAAHYASETQILGYELLNEPIANYWPEHEELNKLLEPLYKRATAAIREVDKNHIIILGAPQWNLNFSVFEDIRFDDKLMYTCHKYDGQPRENIKDFIAFRDSVNLPMYMGEIGHNPEDWQESMCRLMEEVNIGYTFWPYKKVGNECFASIVAPEGWERVKAFAANPRVGYFDIYRARPNQDSMKVVLNQFIENIKLKNCQVNQDYIRSLRLNVEVK